MNTSSRLIKIFAALCIAAVFSLYPFATPASADMGPKPTMFFEFEFVEGIPDLLVMEGSLFECDDSACVQSTPLENFGPQGFSCFGTTCHAMAYGFSDYHKLVLSFSDGVTRESNVFTKNSFEANYTVTVDANNLHVKEGRGYSNPNIFFLVLVGLNILLLTAACFVVIFLIRKGLQARRWLIAALIISLAMTISGGTMNIALPVTLVIELVLALGYALKRKRHLLPTLTLVGLANVITQFALWAALTAFSETNAFFLTIGLEILILGVEALIFYLPQRNEITFKEAALLSLLLNLVSFGIGLLLPI